jgi:hypothetical protein
MTDEEVMQAAAEAGYRQGEVTRGVAAWFRAGEQVSPGYNDNRGLIAWMRGKLDAG